MQQHLLDLLIDAPCSVAGLYGGLIRHCGYKRNLDIRGLLEQLRSMEDKNLVRAQILAGDGTERAPTEVDRQHAQQQYLRWLPTATPDDLSVDEVGLWYALTPKGRALWQSLSAGEPRRQAQWILDHDDAQGTITIQAEDLPTAERALQAWLRRESMLHLVPASRRVQTNACITFRDGTRVDNGVILTYTVITNRSTPTPKLPKSHKERR